VPRKGKDKPQIKVSPPAQERRRVSDHTYHRVFQQSKDGQDILTELAALFHDRVSHTPGDPYQTAFKDGQRAVVLHIIRKCGLALTETEGGE